LCFEPGPARFTLGPKHEANADAKNTDVDQYEQRPSVIMGGGQGRRLFPLTRDRSKPAVPLAGKYRLVDIPISNCINSGLKRIYVLTQFNSASLHRHISQSYKFDHFTGGFVEILAAEQTFSDTSWYQGTADAVRKNLVHFLNARLRLLAHPERRPALPDGFSQPHRRARRARRGHDDRHHHRSRDQAQALGIMQIGPDQRITRFVEKPKDPALQDSCEWTGPNTRNWESRARRIFPRFDGHLSVQARCHPEIAGQHADGFRQAHHSRRIRKPCGLWLGLSGILGGRGHDPVLF
jgi:hypothetical protein